MYQGSRLRRLVEMMDMSVNAHVREPVVLPAPHRLDQRLSNDAVAELVRAYEAGASTADLRQRFGLSQGSVLKLLRTHDVTLRRQGLDEANKSVAVRLYKDGATLAQLGSQFEVSPNVVRRVLLAAGVVMRSRGGSKPRN